VWHVVPPNAQHLLPQICTKSPISRLAWQKERRCLDLLGGFRGWPIQWNHAKCFGADPCCHSNEICARRGDLVAHRLVHMFVHNTNSTMVLCPFGRHVGWPICVHRSSSTYCTGHDRGRLSAILFSAYLAVQQRTFAFSVPLISGRRWRANEPLDRDYNADSGRLCRPGADNGTASASVQITARRPRAVDGRYEEPIRGARLSGGPAVDGCDAGDQR